MSTPRNPDGGAGSGGGGEDDPYSGRPEEAPSALAEEYGDVFDCGALEVSCHISKWFHSLVLNLLEPLFGWVAAKMFTTPPPTEGIATLWHGTLTTVNILYALMVLAVAFVVMSHHGLQGQYGAKELLPRLVVGWVAANVSLTVVTLSASVSTSVATSIVASGINSRSTAENLREHTNIFLGQQGAAVVLFLVVFVVLFVVWMIVEIVRVVIVILLMVGGPLMLAFHTLPQTNRIAQMWWRTLGAVMLVPIAQAIAYVALTRIFFQGDAKAVFGLGGVITEEASLLDLVLLLVLVYVQIRIPMWAYKAVWTPPTSPSPVASMARTAATALVVGAVTGGAGSATAAVGSRANSIGRGLRRRPYPNSATATALPRRARTWRFGKPGTHHTGAQTRHIHTTNTGTYAQTQPHVPGRPVRRTHTTAPPGGQRPNANRPPHPPRDQGSPSAPLRQAGASTAPPTSGRPRQPQQPSHRPTGRTGSGGSSGTHRQPPPAPSAPTPQPRDQATRSGWRHPDSWLPRRRRPGARRRPRPVLHRWWWRR